MPLTPPMDAERLRKLADLTSDPETRAKLLMIAALLRPSSQRVAAGEH